MAHCWYLYILRCKDGSLYTGITTNLDVRVKKHNEGKGAKYTAGRRPVKIVYSEACENEAAARKREVEVKTWPKFRKEKLVKNKNG